VSDGSAQSLIARLEERVASDASAFPALAEALRREGRAAEAEQVARQGLESKPGSAEGSAALALALLDQGREQEARRALEERIGRAFAVLESPRIPVPAPPDLEEILGASLTEREFDHVFAAAETDREQLIDADRVAEEALHRAHPAPVDEIAASRGSPFATHTVANILESQGDSQAASMVRASLQRGDGGGASPAARGGDSRRTIAKLGQWLENLRRPRA
jgi:tetratricopeptide (TPR) repeat protein